MLKYTLPLFLFEHADPTYLPITEELALSLIYSWEVHEDAKYFGIFEAAKAEARTKQAKRTARERLFDNTCIVVEWED